MNRRTIYDFEEIDREAADCDAFLADLEVRQVPRGLVHKTYQPPPMQQPQQQNEDFSEVQRGVLAALIVELRKEWRKSDKKLREEIGSLRADVEILRGIVRGEVKQIPKGKVDVA